MQLLALLILLGILVLLFLAATYFARSQKTFNMGSRSVLDDFYRSQGMGNTLDAGYNLDGGFVPYGRRNSSMGRGQPGSGAGRAPRILPGEKKTSKR